MESVLSRTLDRILPGCQWLHKFQPITSQEIEVSSFHTLRGSIDPGAHRFRPRFILDL